MPPRFPWFPCYASDWLSSARIAAMTAAQEGAYHRLLCLAWNDKDCSLPSDREALASMSKLTLEHLEPVLICFEPHPTLKKRLHNPRLTKEWEKIKAYQQAQSAHGKIGALKRWHDKPISTAIATGMANDSYSHSQRTKNTPKSLKSVVPTGLKDRTAKGFEPLGEGLKDAILKMIPVDNPSE